MAEMAKDDEYDFEDPEECLSDQDEQEIMFGQHQRAMIEAARLAQSQGIDINEIKDHAALSQYLRDNMLYQQRKLKEFLANGNGP